MANPSTMLEVAHAIHDEHREMLQRLANFDRALDHMVCYSEVFADLAGLSAAKETASWLAERLPAHFKGEEEGILKRIAQQGPEGAAFVREMKRQHNQIKARLELFLKMADVFKETLDLERTLSTFKFEGKALSNFMAAHMGAEERGYASVC